MNTRPKVTVAALRKKKTSNKKITLLTAYDAPFASFLDQAGIDDTETGIGFRYQGRGWPLDRDRHE